MLINLFKKFFKKRRSDVSLKVFARFLFLLSYYKILKKIKSEQTKDNSCLILFPPSLGLGDLIILSKIVNIVKESKRYKSISIGHSAPYLQKIDNSISLIDLKKPKELVYFNEVILPSPSLLNGMISFILGRKKCKGYLNNKNITNLSKKNKYKIKFQDPYFNRLKPFKNYFKFKGDIKPFVWGRKEIENLKNKKDYLSIKSLSKGKDAFLIISTYNFYHKFRPTFLSIFREISKYKEINKVDTIVILGANSKEELKYNNSLEKKLKENFKQLIIINLSGKLTISNSLEIISQSEYYIGANNGLANVAQMLGIKCTLIFNGPEKSRKRKFSKFAKIL